MLRRLPVLLLAMLMEVAMAHAANTARIQGRVTDSSGAAIANATVSFLDLTTNQVMHTTTTAEGQFAIDNVPADPQLVTIEKSGFESFTQRSLRRTSQHTITATLQVATLNDSVVVRGTVDPEAKPMPTREDVMLMPETVRVLDRKQLDAAGPVAGGAQVLQFHPGRKRDRLWRDRRNEIHDPAERNPAGLGRRGDKLHGAGLAGHHL